ncbi:MAG: hypothetical protein ACYC9N_12055, partial [Thermoanaerobaculia bacterium]
GRVTGLLTSDNHDRPAWTFGVDSNYAGGSEYALTTHRAEARYARPRVRGFQWSPMVSYMVQTTEDLRVLAPSAGLSASWSRNAGSLDFAATSGAALSRITSSGRDAFPSQDQVSYSAGVSIGHTGRLTERFDASASQNEMRTSSTVENEPGFGSVGSAGTEDSRQMRFTLSGRVSGVTTNVYSDWADRESNVSLPGKDFRTTMLMHSLQIVARKFAVIAGSGKTEVTTDVVETIDFLSFGFSASPLPFLSTTASYRKDRREVPYEPRIDGERLEAGASIRIGAIYVNPMAFWTTERVDEGQERESRGFTMSISRHFGGFFPIVSTPKRRGTIQ